MARRPPAIGGGDHELMSRLEVMGITSRGSDDTSLVCLRVFVANGPQKLIYYGGLFNTCAGKMCRELSDLKDTTVLFTFCVELRPDRRHGSGARPRPAPASGPALCKRSANQCRVPPLSVRRHTRARADSLPAAVPSASVHHLWDAFNDIAEGMGLTSDETCEILRVCLKDVLGYAEKKLDALSRSLFVALDDDQNELIDALEFLAALGALSGMSQEQKITFIFGIFDFDESGVLTVDETILALRSTLSGLCKLSGLELPPETEIERVAVGAFAGVRDIEGSTISKIDFATYCTITPEITSWIDFYGDICETAKPAAPLGDRAVDRFIEALAAPPVRDMGHFLAKDMESGPTVLLELEDAAAAAQADGVPPVEVTRPQPPWLATTAFLEPTDCPAEVAALPAEGLQLEHLFGFNAQRRQHAFYAARGELVYPAGTVGVVLDCASGTQRHAQHHADCVECLRVHHAEGDTWVATGELGARPKVFVWSATTLDVLAIIRGVHRVGVLHVAFSGDGVLLATVGAPHEGAADRPAAQLVAIYDWRATLLLFAADVPAATLVLDARFVHGRDLATCGVNHVQFWRVRMDVSGADVAPGDNGDASEEAATRIDTFRAERGLLCRKAPPQPFLAVAGTGAHVVVGAASGHLLLFVGRTCVQAIKAHAGAVTSLHTVESGGIQGLCSASTDGHIQLWTATADGLDAGSSIDAAALGARDPCVLAVCWDAARDRLAVTTAGGEIFEAAATDGRALHDGQPVAAGHAERRLCGLAPHPSQSHIATCGDDKAVVIWDCEARRPVRSCILDTIARCCAFSPDGRHLAVGLGGVDRRGRRQRKDGAFVVLDTATLGVVHEARDARLPLTCCAFSPDGRALAFGADDRALYVYDAGDFAATTKCRGHRGRVCHIDWSSDAQLIQSCDDAGELLFWEADSGEPRAPRLVRDAAWATQSCIFGWPLRGCWGEDGNGSGGNLAPLTACARLPAVAGGHLTARDPRMSHFTSRIASHRVASRRIGPFDPALRVRERTGGGGGAWVIQTARRGPAGCG